LISYEKQIAYDFFTSYSEVDKTLHTLKQIGILEYEREFGVEGVDWKIAGSEEKINRFKKR
jgi:hypothetical protein